MIKYYSIFTFFVLFHFLIPQAIPANSFNSPRQTFLPSAAYTVATADLNRDGLPDLVVGRYPEANDFTGVITVLMGKGNGNFQPGKQFLEKWDEPGHKIGDN